MNFMRAKISAENRVRARNDILGLLKNYNQIRKPKPKKTTQFAGRGIFSKALSFKILINRTENKKTPDLVVVPIDYTPTVKENEYFIGRIPKAIVPDECTNNQKQNKEQNTTTIQSTKTNNDVNDTSQNQTQQIDTQPPTSFAFNSTTSTNPNKTLIDPRNEPWQEPHDVPVDFDIQNGNEPQKRIPNEREPTKSSFTSDDSPVLNQSPLPILTFDSAIAPHLQNERNLISGSNASNFGSSTGFSMVENQSDTFNIITPFSFNTNEYNDKLITTGYLLFSEDPEMDFSFEKTPPKTKDNDLLLRTPPMRRNYDDSRFELDHSPPPFTDTLRNFSMQSTSSFGMDPLGNKSPKLTMEMVMERKRLAAQRAHERLFSHKTVDRSNWDVESLPHRSEFERNALHRVEFERNAPHRLEFKANEPRRPDNQNKAPKKSTFFFDKDVKYDDRVHNQHVQKVTKENNEEKRRLLGQTFWKRKFNNEAISKER